MSTSQIFTIGTALRRAEDNSIPVEVLVEGQWITGSIAGLDGDGLVLVTPERVQCVVRNAAISVVRLLAGLPADEEPAAPQETTYEYADHGAPDDAPAPWAMPAAPSPGARALASESEHPAAPEHDHGDHGDHDDHEVFVLGAVVDEGPREIEAGSWGELPDPTEPIDQPEQLEAPPFDEPVDEPEAGATLQEPTTPGSFHQGDEWREMLTALRSEAPAPTAAAPERRRARRLVMR